MDCVHRRKLAATAGSDAHTHRVVDSTVQVVGHKVAPHNFVAAVAVVVVAVVEAADTEIAAQEAVALAAVEIAVRNETALHRDGPALPRGPARTLPRHHRQHRPLLARPSPCGSVPKGSAVGCATGAVARG